MAVHEGPTSALDLDDLDDAGVAVPVGLSAAGFAVRVPVAAAVPAAVAPSAAVRLPMFDAMRVVAAFGVVMMHTPQGGPWLKVASTVRFGVAFFTVAALILLARSLDRRPDQGFVDYAVTRVKRLVPPLLLWTAVYVAFYLAAHRWLGTPTFLEPNVGLLVGGAATHLWFLPFILFACVAAFPLLQAAQAAPQAKRWLVPVLVAAGVATVFIPRNFDHLSHGAKVFFFNATWAVPTYFFGLAAALVYPKELAGRWRVVVPAAGVVLFAVAAALAWRGVSSPAVQAAKGLAVAMVALTPWSPRVVQSLAKLGTLSFGVYLVHMLFVVLFRDVGRRFASPDALWFYPAVAVLAFVTSYAVAVVGNRTRLGKVLFP
jgi:peptidoglycan/LPS O-acetylase OafA/YrhL